jgi:hypothetical protein
MTPSIPNVKNLRPCIATFFGTLALLLLTSATLKAAQTPLVAPPGSKPQGKSYGQWSAAWNQWALGLPVEGPPPHPFIDDPGFDVTEGQTGSVWFLAAPFGTVERSCTLPSGKALFITLLNSECSTLECPPFYAATATEQADCARAFADTISDLFCIIDNVPVANIESYRAVSPQYTINAPTPWIYGSTDCPNGGIGTSVSDGYYIFLAPLSVGAHMIHFGGSIFGFPLDMTYTITVKNAGKPGKSVAD